MSPAGFLVPLLVVCSSPHVCVFAVACRGSVTESRDGGAAADEEDREEAGQAVQEAPPRPLQVP
jgi:hypothetical protein